MKARGPESGLSALSQDEAVREGFDTASESA
jgi:hypothetical protein